MLFTVLTPLTLEGIVGFADCLMTFVEEEFPKILSTKDELVAAWYHVIDHAGAERLFGCLTLKDLLFNRSSAHEPVDETYS